MIEETMQVVITMGDNYVMESYIYFRIYGASKYSQIIPNIILDKLVTMEISYQNFIHGLATLFVRDKKAPCTSLPLDIGSFSARSTKKSST